MTQQPFSRPGAFDLSALKRPGHSGQAGRPAPGGAPVGDASGGGAYWLDVTEENFQATIEGSLTAPVLLVFYSPSRLPESEQMARDVATLADEFEGQFLAGLVDIDSAPAIAQAVQLQSVPFVFAVLDGRPAPLLQDVLSLDQLRTTLTQVMESLTAQGMTARHQPRQAGAAAATGEEPEEPAADPRYAAAEDALEADDYDRAVAEYQKLVDANPADADAAAGLAMANVLQRTKDVDHIAARKEAAANPDDVDAQTLVADLDLLSGQLEDAFDRLVDLVRRTSGAERDRAREHLLGLFAAVGNEDPRVLKGRQNLASALF